MIETSRRSFLVGLGALIAAPAIVRASVIMPVKPILIFPEPKIITDLTFPIEGFARIAGWQGEWASIVHKGTEFEYIPRFNNRLRLADEKLADFGPKGWDFTDHPMNGDYRPNGAVATLRDGTKWQRGGGLVS